MSDVRIWHHGLVAEWWAEFNRGGEDIEVFLAALQNVDGPILDLGCGTGRLLVEFLKAGKDVQGCDASSDMIEWCGKVLAESGQSCPLHTQAVHQLQLGQTYAAVYMCGAFGLGGSRADDLEGLKRVHRHLEPGGLLMMDHHLPNLETPKAWSAWVEQPELPRRWPSEGDKKIARDGSEFELKTRQFDFDPVAQTTTLEIDVAKRRDGELVAREQGQINIGLYFKAEIELMLEVAGFSEIEVTGFGHKERPQPWQDSRILFTARA